MQPLALPARKICKLAGYETERRFRLAVERGVMPKPIDPRAKPQLWSMAEVEARLNPTTSNGFNVYDDIIDRRLGVA